jgi:hypothetical protein
MVCTCLRSWCSAVHWRCHPLTHQLLEGRQYILEECPQAMGLVLRVLFHCMRNSLHCCLLEVTFSIAHVDHSHCCFDAPGADQLVLWGIDQQVAGGALWQQYVVERTLV